MWSWWVFKEKWNQQMKKKCEKGKSCSTACTASLLFGFYSLFFIYNKRRWKEGEEILPLASEILTCFLKEGFVCLFPANLADFGQGGLCYFILCKVIMRSARARLGGCGFVINLCRILGSNLLIFHGCWGVCFEQLSLGTPRVNSIPYFNTFEYDKQIKICRLPRTVAFISASANFFFWFGWNSNLPQELLQNSLWT